MNEVKVSTLGEMTNIFWDALKVGYITIHYEVNKSFTMRKTFNGIVDIVKVVLVEG